MVIREWILTRNGHPPMTPKMRVVAQAACYREQRENPNSGEQGHPHTQNPYVRGMVDYVEDVCNGFFEKNPSEYLARKIAATQSAGVMENKFGYQNGRGTGGDDAARASGRDRQKGNLFLGRPRARSVLDEPRSHVGKPDRIVSGDAR